MRLCQTIEQPVLPHKMGLFRSSIKLHFRTGDPGNSVMEEREARRGCCKQNARWRPQRWRRRPVGGGVLKNHGLSLAGLLPGREKALLLQVVTRVAYLLLLSRLTSSGPGGELALWPPHSTLATFP